VKPDATSRVFTSLDAGASWGDASEYRGFKDVRLVKLAGKLTAVAVDMVSTRSDVAQDAVGKLISKPLGGEWKKVATSEITGLQPDGTTKELPYGANGLMVSKTGRLAASFLDGGGFVGNLEEGGASVSKHHQFEYRGASKCPDTDALGCPGPWFVQTLLPGDDALRGMGDLLVATEKTIYGASNYAVLASQDDGRTWTIVADIPQTTTRDLLVPHCKLGRNSIEPVKKVDSTSRLYSDTGSFCIECEEGATRVAADGTCIPPARAKTQSALNLLSGFDNNFGDYTYAEQQPSHQQQLRLQQQVSFVALWMVALVAAAASLMALIGVRRLERGLAKSVPTESSGLLPGPNHVYV